MLILPTNNEASYTDDELSDSRSSSLRSANRFVDLLRSNLHVITSQQHYSISSSSLFLYCNGFATFSTAARFSLYVKRRLFGAFQIIFSFILRVSSFQEQ